MSCFAYFLFCLFPVFRLFPFSPIFSLAYVLFRLFPVSPISLFAYFISRLCPVSPISYFAYFLCFAYFPIVCSTHVRSGLSQWGTIQLRCKGRSTEPGMGYARFTDAGIGRVIEYWGGSQMNSWEELGGFLLLFRPLSYLKRHEYGYGQISPVATLKMTAPSL
jgi:hypothetical protein